MRRIHGRLAVAPGESLARPDLLTPGANRVLTRGRGGGYKRGPLWSADRRGLLIEIVEKREGMRGRRLARREAGGSLDVRALERTFGGPWIGSIF